VKPVRLCLWVVALLSCAEAAADTDVERARKYKKMSAEPLIREMSETCWRAEEARAWRRKLQALPDDPARVREFVNKELAPLKFPCRRAGREREEERRAKLEAEQKAGREAGKRAAEEARKKAEFEWAIKPRFGEAEEFAANGLARVWVNGKWGYINEKGEEVIKPRFDEAWLFAANGLAPVKVNGKWGYINEKGKEVIKPRFDLVWSFAANGLALVLVNGKVGYLNEKGEEVIKPRFDGAWSFSANGLAPVKVNDKWGYIRAPFPYRTDKRPGGE
jgi:hypothetical protein